VQGWYFGLASMFAIMMYLLGFLLLSIPLPRSAGLKRYARKMIHDSFNLVLTIVILDFFLAIVLSWQDVTWCAIYGTTTNQCGMVGIASFQQKTYELIMAAHQKNVNNLNILVLVSTVAVGIGRVLVGLGGTNLQQLLGFSVYSGAQAGATLGSQAASIYEQISSLYGLALVGSDVLTYYAEFIYLNWGVLAGLGVLLCVFPFNIGRRAGFFLVTFPVVSFIMLPLQAFLGPLVAEYISGFSASAGMGFSVFQAFIDPTVVGLAVVPAIYFTFTSVATGSLAAFSGASSIPIQGVPSLAGLGSRLGGVIQRTGKGGLAAAKKTSGIVKKEYESAKRGGHEAGYEYTVRGTTPDGEEVEAPAYKKDGRFVYPRTARTRSGETVDLKRMMQEGRVKIHRSTFPGIHPRRGFKWGRDDTFSRTREAYRQHQTKRHGEWTAGPEGPIPEGTRGGKPGAPGETPGREHAKRERRTSRNGQTSDETARQTGQASGETATGAEEANHKFNRNVAEARYDTNSTFRDKWREHMHLQHHGLTPEDLREEFIQSFANYKAHGFSALDASTAAFFRAHLASEKTSQTGRTGTSEVPGGAEHARTGEEEGTTRSEGRTAETSGTDETTKQAWKRGEERAREEAQRQAQYARTDETSEEKTQRQARYAFHRNVAEAKYDTNAELEHDWHDWMLGTRLHESHGHAGHGQTHDTFRENFIHDFATWKTHGLGALEPRSAEFFKLHAARFRL